MDEVEDIMCDQCIISSDFTGMSLDVKRSYLIVPVNKLWVTIDLLARALLPSVTTVYYSVLRNPQTVVESLKNQLVPALIAFLANSISKSLASVQRISFPVNLNLRTIKDEAHQGEEISEPEKCVECLVLYEPEEIEADVIFIHGIHGGVDKTWKQGIWRHDGHKLKHQSPIRRQSTGNMYVPPRQQTLKRTLVDIYSKIPNKMARKEDACIIADDTEWEIIDEIPEDNREESEDYSKCWPKDWIPKDCPNVRVIALNYSTDILWYPLWAKKRERTGLVARSQEMIEELVKLGVGRKPVIWVGHSKGGLYIKQIILNAWESHDRPEVIDLFWNTKSIMWYSVPHRGSILADISLPILKRSIELLEVQRNCEFVLDLHKKFLEIIETSKLNPEIFSFIETSFTLMSVVYLKIISYDSADPKIGVKCDVPLDHREICKPAGRDCFLYTELIKLISRCLENETS